MKFSKTLSVSNQYSTKWYEIIFEKRVLLLISAFVFFFIVQFFAHWSIVMGENLMKWDIYDAHYPASVMLGDVLKSGDLPMWNPLMMFGLPYYTVVGMPIWYPSTMILALIGYTPSTIAFEYMLHTVIAAFGAFLFIEDHLRRPDGAASKKAVLIALLAGLIYGNSGLLLSNAEHIMIIISAAWLPFVLYTFKKYLETNKLYLLLLAGAFGGLSFLGGYPELFVDMFLFLIPYTLYFNYRKGIPVLKNIGSSALKYLSLCIAAFASCALLAIPFLFSISDITRAGVGMSPMAMQPFALLSAILPGIGKAFHNLEPSMMNNYIGIFTIIALPAIIKSNYRHKKFYLTFAIIFLILSLADSLFLQPILFRFVPMYATFRFPSIVRCFVALFMLLLASKAWLDFLENETNRERVYKFCKVLFFVLLGGSILCFLAGYALNASLVDTNQVILIGNAAFMGALFTGLYLLFIILAKTKIRTMWRQIALVLIVCAEVLSVVYIETPYSISAYKQTEYAYTASVQENIELQFAENRDRNRSVELSDSVRTNSGLNSKEIVFNKTFDEDGYLSFKFTATDTYRHSYNCIINEQNPEIFFTDNVVAGDQASLEKWLNNPAVLPDQIFIENGLEKFANTDLDAIGRPAVISQMEAAAEVKDNTIQATFDMQPAGITKFPMLRLFVSEDAPQTAGLDISFLGADQIFSVKGEFVVQSNEEGRYIDIYYPDCSVQFSGATITVSNARPIRLAALQMERIPYANDVGIDSFQFNSMKFSVDAKSEGVVTIMQMYYPGWHAYVDGQEADIKVVNGCFMGLALPQGNHTIEMEFKPIDFFAGIGVTIAYYALLAIVLAAACFKSRKNKLQRAETKDQKSDN